MTSAAGPLVRSSARPLEGESLTALVPLRPEDRAYVFDSIAPIREEDVVHHPPEAFDLIDRLLALPDDERERLLARFSERYCLRCGADDHRCGCRGCCGG